MAVVCLQEIWREDKKIYAVMTKLKMAFTKQIKKLWQFIHLIFNLNKN